MKQRTRVLESIWIKKLLVGTLPLRIETRGRFTRKVVVGNHVLPGIALQKKYPEQISGMIIELSDGRKATLFSESITTKVLHKDFVYYYCVIEKEPEFSLEKFVGRNRWNPSGMDIEDIDGFAYDIEERYPNFPIRVKDKQFSFTELSQMKVGDVLWERIEYTFVRGSDGSASNGEYRLSANQDDLYRQWFPASIRNELVNIPSTQWGDFLEFIDGNFLNESSIEEFNRIQEQKKETAMLSPFYRHENGSVTNGHLVFPAIRPKGSKEWRIHSDIKVAMAITTSNWNLFLEILIGKVFHGVNFLKIKSEISAVRRRRTQLKRAEERFKKKGECFDNKKFKAIELGRRVLLKGQDNGENDIFVVDSPEHGVGFYLFDDEEIARKWASGEIDFQEARTSARLFTPHTGEWEDRIKEAVSF
jgi:hypothetical protein